METTCRLLLVRHDMNHWKCVFKFCENYPSHVIPIEESNSAGIYMCKTMYFRVFLLVSL